MYCSTILESFFYHELGTKVPSEDNTEKKAMNAKLWKFTKCGNLRAMARKLTIGLFDDNDMVANENLNGLNIAT